MGRTHNITGSNAGQLTHGRTDQPLTTKDLQGIGQLSHFEHVGPMGVTSPKLASPEQSLPTTLQWKKEKYIYI